MLELLSQGFGGSVYTMNDKTVVKIIDLGHEFNVWAKTFMGGTVLLELECIKWANSINGLVVKFKKESIKKDIRIAMERIYPVLSTAFSKEELIAAIEVAELELQELWASGLAHGDLKRPEVVLEQPGNCLFDLYNNIAITEVDGRCVIRLIDLGMACLDQYDEEGELDSVIEKDARDWQSWKNYILSFPRTR